MVLKYLPLLHGQRYMVSRAAGEGNGGGCESSSSGDGNEKKRRRQPYRIAAWTTERGENSCGRLLALACAAYCRGREEGYLTLPLATPGNEALQALPELRGDTLNDASDISVVQRKRVARMVVVVLVPRRVFQQASGAGRLLLLPGSVVGMRTGTGFAKAAAAAATRYCLSSLSSSFSLLFYGWF